MHPKPTFVPAAAYTSFGQAVDDAAAKHSLPPLLVWAIMAIESNFNADARSPVGAIGLMQLMPATAAGLGVNPHDPAANIEGGARYIRSMLARYSGNLAYALAAYNWGPGNLGLPPKPPGVWARETQQYILRFALKYFAEMRHG